jgi:hypothetical protein
VPLAQTNLVLQATGDDAFRTNPNSPMGPGTCPLHNQQVIHKAIIMARRIRLV